MAAVVQKFEHADKTHSHAQSQQSSSVANEGHLGHGQISLDARVVGILQEDLDHGEIVLGIPKHKSVQALVALIAPFLGNVLVITDPLDLKHITCHI